MTAPPDVDVASAVLQVLAALVLDALPVGVAMLAVAVGGAVVARRLTVGPRSLLLATGAGLGLAFVSTGALLLGLAGWLTTATAALLVLVPAAVGVIGVGVGRAFWLRPLPREGGRALWLLPAAALLVALVAACMPAGVLWGGEPNAYDVLSYHLQVPREWHDAGRIVPLEHNVFSRMPMANEALFLVAMHLRGGGHEAMLACQFLNVGLGAAFVLGCYAAARVAGGSALAAATVAACVPWTVMLSTIAYNEPLYLVAAALTVAWLLRAVEAGAWRDAGLAGLFAGLGIATKYTALPMLALAGGLGLIAALLVAKRRPLVPAVAYGAAAMLLPLPWLVRNVAWYGNPVSPLAFGVDGWSPEQIDRFADAHAQPLSHAPIAIWNDLLANGRFGWLLVPAGLFAIALLAKRRRAELARLALLGVPVVAMLVVWATATHQVGRFLVPIVPLLAVAIAVQRRPIALVQAIVIGVAGLTYTLALHEGWGLVGLLGGGRSVLLGASGAPFYLTPLREDELDRPVHLVGDAKAYAYPGEVHYKVVFDVPPARDAVRAWLGDRLEEAPAGDLVVIDAGEVERLGRTYGTPPLPPEVEGSGVVTMGELRRRLGLGGD